MKSVWLWLIVLLLSSILGLFVIGLKFGTFDGLGSYRTNEEVTWSMVNKSYTAQLLKFRIDVGRYPTTEEGISILFFKPETDLAGYKGPYLKESRGLLDPWGNTLQYRFPAVKSDMAYDLFSYGPDGKKSEDDIGNWSRDPKS